MAESRNQRRVSVKNCDLCQKRPAVHKVNRINEKGEVELLELCEECAQRKGILSAKELKTLIEILAELKKKILDEDAKLVCPRCQLTLADFKRSGKFGCAECYIAFRTKIYPILKELHHSTQHTGKVIRETTPRANMQRLKEELKSAIAREDYEKAAQIRDTLKRHQKEKGLRDE